MNMSSIKQLFCLHDFYLAKEITHLPPYYYQCKKCGKVIVTERLCYGNRKLKS